MIKLGFSGALKMANEERELIPIESNGAHLPTPRYWPYRGVGRCAPLLSIGSVS